MLGIEQCVKHQVWEPGPGHGVAEVGGVGQAQAHQMIAVAVQVQSTALGPASLHLWCGSDF